MHLPFYLGSSFAIIPQGKGDLVALWMLFYCSLPLPRGVVGWSVVCDSVISWSYPIAIGLIL